MDFLAVLSDNEQREGPKPKLLGIGRIANWSSSKQGITHSRRWKNPFRHLLTIWRGRSRREKGPIRHKHTAKVEAPKWSRLSGGKAAYRTCGPLVEGKRA